MGSMTQRISDDELDRLEQLAASSTSAPWKSFIEGRDHDSGSSFISTQGEDRYLTGATEADQDFIAAARNALPDLLDELRKSRARTRG
jgi:hypothetical protein